MVDFNIFFMLKCSYKGRVFLGETKDEIITIIKKYYPRVNVDDLIFSIKTENKKGIKQKKVSFKDAVHGANALVNINIGSHVDQQEITRRSLICQGCEHMDKTSNCYSCGFAGKFTTFITKLKKAFGYGFQIPNGIDKNYCDICNCSLAVMIPSKLEAFKKENKTRPDNCWIKK